MINIHHVSTFIFYALPVYIIKYVGTYNNTHMRLYGLTHMRLDMPIYYSIIQ